MSADWLMAELLKIARSAADEKTRLTAVVAALDRVGFGSKSSVDIEIGAHTLSAFEETLAKVVRLQRLAPEPSPDYTSAVERGTIGDLVDAELVNDDEPPCVERLLTKPTEPLPATATATATANDPGANAHSHVDLYGPKAPPKGSAAANRRGGSRLSRTDMRNG